MKQFSYTIQNELGIHARLASWLTREATKFESTCTITHKKKTVKLNLLRMVMSLGVRKGDTVIVKAEGPDEAVAIAALKECLEAYL